MTDREKAIVMAYTGCTMLAGDKLGIYYKYVHEKLCRSVMTHELAYQEVQNAIQEAAKEDFIALAKEDNGWISVKDRLPKESGKYLIVAVEQGRIHHVTTAMCGTYFHMTGKMAHWRVTHWMPLPEPPKEETC